jgi:hypothetical protein
MLDGSKDAAAAGSNEPSPSGYRLSAAGLLAADFPWEGPSCTVLRILYCSTSTEILTQPADFSANQTEIQCQFRSACSMQPAGQPAARGEIAHLTRLWR